MQDNTLVILGLVGLALVCAGLFLFVGLTLFRVTGYRLLGFFSLLARDADEAVPPSYPPSSVPDLHAIAEAQDFDSALARHGAAPVQSSPVDAASPFSPTPTPRFGSRRSSHSEVRRDDEDDELFGGLLEDDQIP